MEDVLRSAADIRHAAVHRLRLSARGLEQFIVDAESLATLIQDDICLRALSALRRETVAVIEELERNKHILNANFEIAKRKIAAQRAELDQLEKTAAWQMDSDDQEYQTIAGSSLDQAITAFGSGGSSNISINDYKAELVEKAEYPNDPQKGKFGGSPIDEKKHRKLSVVVEEIPNNDYFRRLIVKIESTEPQQFPLDKDVTFHLHPSFAKPVITVKPENNKAEIKLVAWGAFTVGAETDNGETRLEFDISKENEGNNDPFYFK